MNDNKKWDLSDLYKSENDVFKDLELASQLVEKFIANFKDNFQIKTCLKTSLDDYFAICQTIEKPLTFAHHKLDESTTNQASIRLEAKVKTTVYDLYSKLSFYMPLLTENSEYITNIINQNQLIEYEQTLKEIVLNGKFTLDQKSEKILAMANESVSMASKIYEVLTNADMKFDNVIDEKGDSKPMSHGLYSAYIMDYDRTLRKNAFNEMLNQFSKVNQTLTATYIGEITKDIFHTKIRGYSSTRSKALISNNIDEQIYDNLLEVVNSNLHLNHKYIKLRKQVLNIEKLHLYDMYVPLIKNIQTNYSYEEACSIALNALKPLGPEYVSLVQKAIDERWIDVYEREGKRSGAYSGGCYGSKPYILLNYTNTLNDVYTLVHELGHSIHTYLANQKQAYHNSKYVIFIAEIASTVNELLLTNYLFDNAENNPQKANILNYKLEQYRTTVLRQTMFADFEYKTKSEIENGYQLASEDLNNIYLELNKKYFGTEICIDENIKYEWSRIPHFYYNYYVYQYATSFCYAVDIVKRISENKDFSQNYLNFLAIGGSKDAISSLHILNIDALKKEPYETAFDDFAETLNKIDQLINLEERC